MEKKRYDLVLPLGGACSCAQLLKARGLRFASYPFDWLLGGDIRLRADVVADGFRSWMNAEDFQLVETSGGGMDVYRNVRTGLVYMHDFPKGIPFDRSFPEVQAKYAVRSLRLQETLASSRRVLIVWVQTPNGGPLRDGQIAYCLEVFKQKFPGVSFDMRVLDFAAGVDVAHREVVQKEGATVCRFDYREYDNPGYPHAVVLDRMKPAMADVEALDRRTLHEKLEFAKKCRLAKYKRFGVNSMLECFFVKLEYKLYHHLRHVLEKRGVILDRSQM